MINLLQSNWPHLVRIIHIQPFLIRSFIKSSSSINCSRDGTGETGKMVSLKERGFFTVGVDSKTFIMRDSLKESLQVTVRLFLIVGTRFMKDSY